MKWLLKYIEWWNNGSTIWRQISSNGPFDFSKEFYWYYITILRRGYGRNRNVIYLAKLKKGFNCQRVCLSRFFIASWSWKIAYEYAITFHSYMCQAGNPICTLFPQSQFVSSLPFIQPARHCNYKTYITLGLWGSHARVTFRTVRYMAIIIKWHSHEHRDFNCLIDVINR